MKRFSNILLVVEAETDHAAALNRAITLAKNNQSALTVCTVVDVIPAEIQMAIIALTLQELVDIAVSDRRDHLANLAKVAAKSGVDIEVAVLQGKPFVEIIRRVLSNKHDLVIKCAEGAASLEEKLFGSTDMHLMRKCPCPVWIIKSTEHQQYRRVLAAVDRHPEEAAKDVLNRQILEMSSSVALTEFSELHIVHAWRLFGESYLRSSRFGASDAEIDVAIAEGASERRRWLEDLVDTYAAKTDRAAIDYIDPQLHVVRGDARHLIPAKARELDIDLLVMGTVARTGIPGFVMGNTAESILNQIDCSVLTVKPPGFVSPVVI